MKTKRASRRIVEVPAAPAAEPAGAAHGEHCCGATERPTRTSVVDATLKEANLTRLRRIEGQIRGIGRMIEEDRYCADVLAQIAAAQAALRAVGRELMRHHLKHCVPDALAKGRSNEAVDELMDLMYKNVP